MTIPRLTEEGREGSRESGPETHSGEKPTPEEVESRLVHQKAEHRRRPGRDEVDQAAGEGGQDTGDPDTVSHSRVSDTVSHSRVSDTVSHSRVLDVQ